MAEKDLVEVIGKKYSAMSREKRVRTIRSLNEDGRAFVRKFFPTFYFEAYTNLPRQKTS